MGYMDLQRVVAVDWSGDKGPGQRKKIWAGVWTEGASGSGGRFALEGGRTREELGAWLVGMAEETPRMVVGVDFCFSYPAWFLEEQGAKTAPEFWKMVVERGEHWLSKECEDVRFWGRAGISRTGKKPPEFCGDSGHRMFRRADEACKVRSKILDPEQALKVKGIAPKSPFQIGGAGAVGTGTLRGIPLLLRLAEAGFSVWPFSPAHMPMVLEIYPRLLTGPVNKSNYEARKAYLADRCSTDHAFEMLDEDVVAKARRSEDAFDALVSVIAMVAKQHSFRGLEQATDPNTLLEGAVWGADG